MGLFGMTQQLTANRRNDASEPRAPALADSTKAAGVSSSMRRRVVISSTIGNALEWYDFGVFGLLAGVISGQFFSTSDPSAALLMTFGTFGLAFAARPLGGLVFGLRADRHGRKSALVVMIWLMAAGTGLVGILPNYETIGIAAPALLVCARFIQGFSAGGEFGNASAMLIEFAPAGERGFYGSFQMVSQSLAFTLAAVTVAPLSMGLTADQFANWGWRIPFLLGILIGPAGWYLRQRVDESPEFRAFLAERSTADRPDDNAPLKKLLGEYPRELAAAFCLMASVTAINYVLTVFLPAFVATDLGLPLPKAHLGLLYVTLVTPFIAVAFGILSDRFSRRAIVVPALIAFPVAFYVLMQHLVGDPSVTHLWQLQATGLILAALAGPVPAFMTEIFPVEVRSTGSSLMYNLSAMLFGGLAPFINTWLVQVTGQKTAPVYFILVAAVVGLFGMALFRRRAPEQTHR